MTLNIVQVSSECTPYAKTGGLADVVGALGPVLGRAGHRVVTVLPRYGSVNLHGLGVEHAGSVGLVVGGYRHDVHFLRLRREHDTIVFLDHPLFTHRSGIYGDNGGSFGDNHLRFALLSRAAIEVARRVPIDGEPLGEDVIFHAHDWHAALLPIQLESAYRTVGLFPGAGTVLTLHNLAHQGRLPAAMFHDLELPPRWMQPWALEWHGDLCLLKGGILHAGRLTTVSPTYAREIQTRDGGFGLDSVLRHRSGDLVGVLNGIDAETWDPRSDLHLPAHFSVDDLAGKAVCKATLQAELGLPVNAGVPLVGAVGRLDPQKGVELLIDSIPWLVRRGAQVVVLGSAGPAHAQFEQSLRQLEAQFPRNVRAWIGFSEHVAHRIEAGADLFAMPSRFEPCGLNQMYSQAYGTLPVVRSTGGLVDTVRPPAYGREQATGFRFDAYTAFGFRGALWEALRTWKEDPNGFKHMQRNAMRIDNSWEARIPTYEAIYESTR